MDKIMSTRMDEAVIRRIGMLADKLGTSKKAVLENAVRHYARRSRRNMASTCLTIPADAGSAMNRPRKR